MQNANQLVITFATANYADKLTLLLSSYAASNKDEDLRVYCMGWPSHLLSAARKAYPKFEFVQHMVDRAITKELHKTGRSGTLLKHKPELLWAAYNETRRPVLWIDADSLVMKPLRPMINRVNAYGDIGVTMRPRASIRAKVAAAVLYFARTEKAAKVLWAYTQDIKRCKGSGAWFHDQMSLYQTCQRYNPKIISWSETEHALHGTTTATIISRRCDFEVADMKAVLRANQIQLTPIRG